MIQNIIAAILVLIASFFIGKRFWDTFRHKKETAGCAKCDLNTEKK